MPQVVADDHFVTGVWAASGPLRFRRYSCVACGHRSATWPAFRAHRAECRLQAPATLPLRDDPSSPVADSVDPDDPLALLERMLTDDAERS